MSETLSMVSDIDLITSTEQFKTQQQFTAAVFLDTKRALDSIMHGTILDTLEKEEFGGRLCN